MAKIIIKKPHKFSLNLNELWSYRELFYFFAWRDIKVRYKQSILGFLWAVLQPLALVLAFSLFLPQGSFMGQTTIPPVLFYFSGILMWNIFSQGVAASGNSILENSDMIQKIYFPRLIIPVSAIIVSLFDFLMGLLIFLVIGLYYQNELVGFNIWGYLPLFLLALIITILTTLGISFLLSALTVKYRDFRYVLGFFVQFMFFLTPIIFSTQKMVDKLGVWAYANPLTSSISIVRNESPSLMYNQGLFLSLSVAIIFFIGGLFYFRKTEAYFADII